jgi:hypothetical protein
MNAATRLSVEERRDLDRAPADTAALQGRERSTVEADVYSEHPGSQVIRATRTARDASVAFVKSARSLVAT